MFALHVYWALMLDDPLSVEELAEGLLLAGVYGGKQTSLEGLHVLHATLEVLDEMARTGRTAVTDISPAIVKRFT